MEKKLQYHFLNLFNFALADTQIDVKEAEKLYDIALEKGISKSELDYVIDNPHKIHTVLPTDIDEIIEQTIDIAKIILADGKVDIREIQAFKKFLALTLENSMLIEDIVESVIDSVKDGLENTTIKEKLLLIIQGEQDGWY